MRKTLSFIFTFFLFCSSVFSQRAFWYSNDQLSNNQIQSICQDDQGFIWIATEYGLNKFDGNRFTYFFHDESDSLSLLNNYVRCLSMSSDGNMWVGTASGLQLFSPGQGVFNSVSMPENESAYIVQILSLKKTDQIWFITSGNGIYTIEPENPLRAVKMSNLNLQAKNLYCKAIFEDSSGLVWLGLANGVAVCNPKTMSLKFFRRNRISSEITGIHEDDFGNIFISSTKSLFKWKRSSDTLEKLFSFENIGYVTHSFMDSKKKLYIAVKGNGLRYYDPVKEQIVRVEHYITEVNFNRLDISAMFVDKNENIWLGGYLSGLLMISNVQSEFKYLRFANYGEEVEGSVTALMCDNKQNIWISYNNNGITSFNANGELILKNTSQPYARTLLQSKEGIIWAGLFNGGVSQIETTTGRMIPIPYDTTASVPCLAEDSRGCLFYSTSGSGFSAYNFKTGEYNHWSKSSGIDNEPNLDDDWINAMCIDRDDMLWLGHYLGINCYDIRNKKFIDTPELNKNITRKYCNVIIEDNEGQLWIGTNKGLFMYNKNRKICRQYRLSDGLSNETICAIAQDNEGNIWCSTLMGLNKLDLSTGVIDRFYSGSGLIDNTYNMRAYTKDNKSGAIYFASNQGITSFIADQIVNNQKVNDVILTSFFLNDAPVNMNTLSKGKSIIKRPVSEANEFRLAYTDNSFTMEFNTFNYAEADGISYEYTFNYEKGEWKSTPAGVNRVYISHLSPGRHNITVRACLNNSYSNVRTYRLNIAPPWYLSGWAYIFYTLMLFGALSLLIRNNHRQRQQELSEAKLDSFTNIAHEICSPMTMIISPLNDLISEPSVTPYIKKPLTLVYKNSIRILRLLSQLLDIRKYDEGLMTLKFREIDLVSLLNDTFTLFSYWATQRGIKYTYNSSVDNLNVWIDPDSLDKVMMNLISNAFKYTPNNGEITVELTVGSNDEDNGPLREYVEVSITDTGTGLDVSDVRKVFQRFYRAGSNLTSVTLGSGIGLNYSRILVEMHHGIINACNRSDRSGSCFFFRLPLGRTHIKDDDISVGNGIVRVELEQERTILSFSDQENNTPEISNNTTLLIIDDDDFLLEFIQSGLKKNFKIITCNNGREGLRQAIVNNPDLIITDVVMPEMDGIKLVKLLKNNPNICHIPVIMLTALGMPHERMAGIEIGADAYLSKPFYMRELRIVIDNLISNRLKVKGKFSGFYDKSEDIESDALKSADTELMEQVIKVVNENMSNIDFSVDQLAELLNISRTHLNRKLKNITGLSSGRFIQNSRMNQAVKLFKENRVSISAAASAVGFSSQSHFSTTFKNFTGISPKDFIKQAEQENLDNRDPA
ncbi:MAG TPA: two-component regulator propeller domain-containing protein [Bacteroidaceae bacterium]|nr:two-component regulator propeller domain-containing protein [Bacteroidaceae bacterium]